MHLPTNTILNNKQYRIKQVIGQGGLGITYLADEIGYYRNTGFSNAEYVVARNPEKVVIKELYYSEYCRRNTSTGLVNISIIEKHKEFEKLVQNQLEEGKKLKSLNHPNIVRTRDIFEENGTAYMVMDYIESVDLEDILRRDGKLDKGKAIKYIKQVLSALIHVHDCKKLHLDIKPSNIIIKKDSDEAILIDFGASQSYDENGQIMGKTSQLVPQITRVYAPNEQQDITNIRKFFTSFDTYATGATLYHLLTGKIPPLSSLLSSGYQKLTPPSALNNNSTSDYIDAVITKALAPMFFERFQSAGAFYDALHKEQEYLHQIDKINELFMAKKYQLALECIDSCTARFFQTNSLINFRHAIQSELDKVTEIKETPSESLVKEGYTLRPAGEDTIIFSVSTVSKPVDAEIKNKRTKLIAYSLIVSAILFIAIIYFSGKSKTAEITLNNNPSSSPIDTPVQLTDPAMLLSDTGNWKVVFIRAFEYVRAKENTLTAHQLLQEYMALYKLIPETADAQRKQVDERMVFWAKRKDQKAETSKIADSLKIKSTVQALIKEADNLFENGEDYEASLKYKKANALLQGSGDKGYLKLLTKTKTLYDGDPCAPPYLNRLKAIRSIKNTPEITALINSCH